MSTSLVEESSLVDTSIKSHNDITEDDLKIGNSVNKTKQEETQDQGNIGKINSDDTELVVCGEDTTKLVSLQKNDDEIHSGKGLHSNSDDETDSGIGSSRQNNLQHESDSDSDNDISFNERRKKKRTPVHVSGLASDTDDEEANLPATKTTKTQNSIDSDSDDETDLKNTSKSKIKSSGFLSDSNDEVSETEDMQVESETNKNTEKEETTVTKIDEVQVKESNVEESGSDNDSVLTDKENDNPIQQEDEDSESENDAILNDDTLTTNVRQQKERKSKTISKAIIKETKSEQQRLLREQSLRIPYHTPEVKPLKDFLQRVPKLEKKVTDTMTPPVEWNKSKTLSDIFKAKPRLSLPNEINLDSSSDEEMDTSETKGKKSTGLDQFMKRFKKHAECKTSPEVLKKNNSTASFNSKVPVKARLEFKDQLKSNILKKRQEFHEDLEEQMNFYDEENYGDNKEDILDYDGDTDESDSDHEENPFKNAGSDDDGGEEVEETNQKEDNKSIDAAIPTTSQSDFLGEDSSSTVSSFLPPGQGEPSFSRPAPLNEMTPFTKLLKIGLLDSATKDSKESSDVPSLSLPNEDTQDLYRDETSYVENDDADEEEDCENEKFSLALDEDTQFGDVLNTQGFLQDSKKSKKEPAKKDTAKKLFADDMELGSTMSMTQVLGFCSGQFEEKSNTSESNNNEKDSSINLKLDNDEGTSMTQALGLLSGKFTADDESKDDSMEGVSALNDNTTTNTDETTENVGNESKEDEKSEVNDASKDNDKEEGKAEEDDDDDDDEDLDEENKENIDFTKRRVSGFHLSESEQEEEEEEQDEVTNKKQQHGDENDEEQHRDDDNDNDDGEQNDENDVVNEEMQGVWKKKMFYENEAELSGSDVGSDDEDLGSEYDEYEVDEDADKQYTSTSKLKKQVHKIHQRKMLDEDRKELRLLQELYLEDGDLGGGMKRKRNFRWRNIDNDDFSSRTTNDQSDEENNDQIETVDIAKRMDRLERDNFIQEIQEKESLGLDECSQSVLNRISSQEPTENSTMTKVSVRSSSQGRHSYPQAKKFKRSGSFLGGVKSVTNDLMTNSNPNTRSGKAFVFQAANEMKKTKTKVQPTAASPSASMEPARKVARTDKLKSKSVFHLM